VPQDNFQYREAITIATANQDLKLSAKDKGMSMMHAFCGMPNGTSQSFAKPVASPI